MRGMWIGERGEGWKMTGKTQLRGGKFTQFEESHKHRAACRAMYEATPGMTISAVSRETGVAEGTLRKWKHEAAKASVPWRPARHRLPDLAGVAGELANKFETKMSELGKPVSDEAAAREAELATSARHAAEVRAQLIRRHRGEWSGPRQILYSAIKNVAEGDVAEGLERAKMAKIASETLTLVQAGERRAWGLDHQSLGPDAEGVVVVIERKSK